MKPTVPTPIWWKRFVEIAAMREPDAADLLRTTVPGTEGDEIVLWVPDVVRYERLWEMRGAIEGSLRAASGLDWPLSLRLGWPDWA